LNLIIFELYRLKAGACFETQCRHCTVPLNTGWASRGLSKCSRGWSPQLTPSCSGTVNVSVR